MLTSVFVYGTLRKGLAWHHLLEGSVSSGIGTTQEMYAMYADGIPYVCENEKISHIKGEIYLVDDSALKRLDRLEGHPDWYERKEVIINSDSGETKAWIYFNPTPKGKLVASGDFYNK